MDDYIKKKDYPPAVREYLLARNISMMLDMQGITPGLDSIYGSFTIEYPSSSYLPTYRAI